MPQWSVHVRSEWYITRHSKHDEYYSAMPYLIKQLPGMGDADQLVPRVELWPYR